MKAQRWITVFLVLAGPIAAAAADESVVVGVLEDVPGVYSGEGATPHPVLNFPAANASRLQLKFSEKRSQIRFAIYGRMLDFLKKRRGSSR
jgi:hypothetical protein